MATMTNWWPFIRCVIQKYVGTTSDLDDHGPKRIDEGILTLRAIPDLQLRNEVRKKCIFFNFLVTLTFYLPSEKFQSIRSQCLQN